MRHQYGESILREAFRLEPRPEERLHQAVLGDQTMAREISNAEWAAAAALDEDRNWSSYSDEELIACEVALAHLPEEAFVYYLPAFIGFCSRHLTSNPLRKGSRLASTVIFSLTDRSPYNLARLKRLTSAQRAVVVDLLEDVARAPNEFYAPAAADALEKYWKSDEAEKPLIVIP